MWWHTRTNLDQAAGVSGNPSSPHTEGRAAKAMLEDARLRIARLLEVKADDVLFTSGATEANALSLLGYVRACRRAGIATPHVLYLASAHASTVENVLLLAEEGVLTEALPLTSGLIDTERLAAMLRPETVLVAMEALCGETGTRWNVRAVAQVLHAARAGRAMPIRLHVDASQVPSTERVLRARYEADMLVLDSGKVSSEQGMGVLVVPRTVPLVPLYRGGGQERGLRPGTESPVRAAHFASALERAAAESADVLARATGDRLALTAALAQEVPEALVYEAPDQVPNILNLSLVGYDTDYLVALLDNEGIAVATKSACETDSSEGSRAVFALTRDRARAGSTLRVSWGSDTTRAQLLQLPKALKRVLPLARL